MLRELFKKLREATIRTSHFETVVSQAKLDRTMADRKIDTMLATLNGEDTWFLCKEPRTGERTDGKSF